MSREPILSSDDVLAQAASEQAMTLNPEEDQALRPQRMEEMVGQREVYERLKIAVDAAQIREEPLGHILLDGPPGLGKTTFATCIPRELNVPLQIASGAALAAPKDLLPYLSNAEAGSPRKSAPILAISSNTNTGLLEPTFLSPWMIRPGSEPM